MRFRISMTRAAIACAIGVTALALSGPASAQGSSSKKPNILVIFGDDIGQTNISA